VRTFCVPKNLLTKKGRKTVPYRRNALCGQNTRERKARFFLQLRFSSAGTPACERHRLGTSFAIRRARVVRLLSLTFFRWFCGEYKKGERERERERERELELKEELQHVCH
jgi:hypothetical protein